MTNQITLCDFMVMIFIVVRSSKSQVSKIMGKIHDVTKKTLVLMWPTDRPRHGHAPLSDAIANSNKNSINKVESDSSAVWRD